MRTYQRKIRKGTEKFTIMREITREWIINVRAIINLYDIFFRDVSLAHVTTSETTCYNFLTTSFRFPRDVDIVDFIRDLLLSCLFSSPLATRMARFMEAKRIR